MRPLASPDPRRVLARRLLPADLVALGQAADAPAQNFAVTNLNDSGAGSLRQAILDADDYSAMSAASGITIQAGLSGTITLASDLPIITQSRGSLHQWRRRVDRHRRGVELPALFRRRRNRGGERQPAGQDGHGLRPEQPHDPERQGPRR